MTRQIFQFVGPRTNSDGQLTVTASQHINAVENGKTNDFGRALMHMLAGWEEYAAAHQKRYEDGIGEDSVIGEYWAEAGMAIKRLLDGETGGLDCGSLASNILAKLDAEGIQHDCYHIEDVPTT